MSLPFKSALILALFGLARLTPALAAASEEAKEHAFLGVVTASVQEELKSQLELPFGAGIVVRFVSQASPAEIAGLQRGDILFKLDDQMIFNPAQLASLVRGHKPNDPVTLGVLRKGAQLTLSAVLAGKTDDGEGLQDHANRPLPLLQAPPGGMIPPGAMWNDEEMNERLQEIEKAVQEQLNEALAPQLRREGGGCGESKLCLPELPRLHKPQAEPGRKDKDQHDQDPGSGLSINQDPGQDTIINLGANGLGGLPSGSRVQVFQSSRSTVNGVSNCSVHILDGDHDISITGQDNEGRIVIKTPDGKVLHDLPWSEREKLPVELRAKIDKVRWSPCQEKNKAPAY